MWKIPTEPWFLRWCLVWGRDSNHPHLALDGRQPGEPATAMAMATFPNMSTPNKHRMATKWGSDEKKYLQGLPDQNVDVMKEITICSLR